MLLGLASGLSWGVADFMGGLASRRAAALAAVALQQSVGLALALAGLAILRPGVPPARDILFGCAAGVCGAVGLAAFYRALAVGTMSLVAPVSALGALVPLVADLARGAAPGALALAGMAVALAGASIASRAPGPAGRRGVGLALAAALGFGGFFTLLAEAASDSALWALASARMGSVPFAIAALLVLGVARGMPRAAVGLAAAAGVLDSGANLLFAAGTQHGYVSVVAVLGSLYPVATLALAGALLGERLGRLQAAGAGIALAGVALIAAA
ncbi:EamA family transporter [Miltoncostaea marina]|uniref:EamA family transporter n=1 Tax=Miltoncostaea marina TaxID=2843215 RepID=UPI001C3C3DC7|nr:EamA family transporter [Miltoncostaea marina]